MLGLGIGYFAWYTPYSALAKALSGGLLPGLDHPVGGLVLLPSAALGTLAAMPVFLLASGWWRRARTRRVAGIPVPFPGRETAASAFWMALIVGTTTLNFTFAGFSILFMLVMMRIETIVLAPTMDLVRRRRIGPYSWLALGLSLLSAVIALADVRGYKLSLAAALSLATYLLGYTGRFEIMSRHAKTGQPSDRRYFVEEHMATPVMLVLLLAVPALINQGPAMRALREGFTTFLVSPAAPYGFAIGVCYEGLFIFTTLIFLDRREYAFCMPVHVCASLLAGVAAALILGASFGTPAPTPAQLGAAACVVLAAFALNYPALRARWLTGWAATRMATWRPTGAPTVAPAVTAPMEPAGTGSGQRSSAPVPSREAVTVRLLLFVCGQNTARSAMAEAIARAEIARAGPPPARDDAPTPQSSTVDNWALTAYSAGISTRPGTAMVEPAVEALHRLGVPALPHRSRQLTSELCRRSAAVYCMTKAQRAAVIALVPDAAERTFCLDPAGDIPEPAGHGTEQSDNPAESYLRCARTIRQQVRTRLGEHFAGLAVQPGIVQPGRGG